MRRATIKTAGLTQQHGANEPRRPPLFPSTKRAVQRAFAVLRSGRLRGEQRIFSKVFRLLAAASSATGFTFISSLPTIPAALVYSEMHNTKPATVRSTRCEEYKQDRMTR